MLVPTEKKRTKQTSTGCLQWSGVFELVGLSIRRSASQSQRTLGIAKSKPRQRLSPNQVLSSKPSES
jgi:hypothetical protein